MHPFIFGRCYWILLYHCSRNKYACYYGGWGGNKENRSVHHFNAVSKLLERGSLPEISFWVETTKKGKLNFSHLDIVSAILENDTFFVQLYRDLKDSCMTPYSSVTSKGSVRRDNNEMILMIKALRKQNICDLVFRKCAWNKNHNKDVISEEFMVFEGR